MSKIVVDCGRFENISHHFDNEDGFTYAVSTWVYGISFTTHYGEEYVLLHTFPDTDAGKAQAERVTAKIQASIDVNGIEAIDQNLWSSRTIYGSQAYLDEEPFIVAREKADDLMGAY